MRPWRAIGTLHTRRVSQVVPSWWEDEQLTRTNNFLRGIERTVWSGVYLHDYASGETTVLGVVMVSCSASYIVFGVGAIGSFSNVQPLSEPTDTEKSLCYDPLLVILLPFLRKGIRIQKQKIVLNGNHRVSRIAKELQQQEESQAGSSYKETVIVSQKKNASKYQDSRTKTGPLQKTIFCFTASLKQPRNYRRTRGEFSSETLEAPGSVMSYDFMSTDGYSLQGYFSQEILKCLNFMSKDLSSIEKSFTGKSQTSLKVSSVIVT